METPLPWKRTVYLEPRALPLSDEFRDVPLNPRRDFFTCTHGTVDVACTKSGYPPYRTPREKYAGQESKEEVRFWPTSLFGGHVCAPTFIHMSEGYFRFFVGMEQARRIIRRDCPVKELRGRNHGGAGMRNASLQAAE